jgi:drug/metabolite transporter (DMT)-like permease
MTLKAVLKRFRAQQAVILNHPSAGVGFALLSTSLLGWAPIFGKMAYNADVDAFSLVALRTLIAAALLWLAYLVRWRSAIPISGHDLIGCLSMGVVNGIGSLFYYTGLTRIDASTVGLLDAMKPIWVFIFLSASGQDISRMAFVRLGLALSGLALLTGVGGPGQTDSLGVMLILASAATNAWYMVLGQWVLADVQARTVTLYMLTSMAVTVGAARLLTGPLVQPIAAAGWQAIVLLALVTAASRLLMFAGLRKLGGIQTALLGLTELFITLLVAYVVLGERLGLWQWIGGSLIIVSVLLVSREGELTVTSIDSL